MAIIKRGKKFCAIIHLGRGRQKWRTFNTRREAEVFEARSRLDGASIAPARYTTADWLGEWLGGRPSGTATAIEDFIAAERKRGVAEGSIALWIAVLSTALTRARKRGLIRENPVSLIDRPKPEPAPRSHLDAEQSRLFLAAVERSSLGSLFKLLIATGARSCAARALREEDVDLPVVYFRTKVRRVKGGWVVEPTLKSKSSKRAVTLPPFAAEAIRALLTGQGGFLWHQADGAPLGGHHVQTELDRICKMAGITRVSIHGLRHTSATLLAHGGVAPQVIQHRLGHSKIGITMDRYAHELTGGDAPAAEILERMVRGTKETEH